MSDNLDVEFMSRSDLKAEVTKLRGENKGLVLRNRVLRARPDLPVERMDFHDALARAQEELAKLRGS
jgi:hypothetical protein